jgi:hypothetical protein
MEGGQVRPMLERISRRFPVKGSDAVHGSVALPVVFVSS